MLALLLATLPGAPPAWADAPAPIPLELNKLEPLPVPAAPPGGAAAATGGCRAYMVVTNPDPEPISQLRLDLILFGKDGVILRRIALDLGPLAPRKTAVRLFDLQGQPCDGMGRILVNDVLACQKGQPATGQPAKPCRPSSSAKPASTACRSRRAPRLSWSSSLRRHLAPLAR